MGQAHANDMDINKQPLQRRQKDLFKMAGKNTHIINADYPHSKRALLGNSVAITGDDTDQILLLVNGIQQ